MRRRATVYRIYAVFTLAAVAGCTWWLFRVRDALSEEESVVEPERAKHVPAPDLERFPYERSATPVVTATVEHDAAGTVPTLWVRGNGVVVRKVEEDDDALDYQRAVIPKASIDALVTALLERSGRADAGEATVVVTLSGKHEVRTFRLGRDALDETASPHLQGAAWKPARLRRIRLAAFEAEADDAVRWPVARLPLRRLADEGTVVSTVPAVNATIQRRVPISGFYRHGDGTLFVTAVPSVEP